MTLADDSAKDTAAAIVLDRCHIDRLRLIEMGRLVAGTGASGRFGFNNDTCIGAVARILVMD